MKLIVGLGNPEPKYAKTRHNFGFLVMTALIEKLKDRQETKLDELNTLYTTGKTSYLKPMNSMNNSGLAVRRAFKNLKMNVLTANADVLVIHDNMDLDLGKCKMKASGNDRHNGLKSIMAEISTQYFVRLGLGIGRMEGAVVLDYVLGTFNDQEILVVNKTIERACEVVDCFISNGANEAMKMCNTKG